MHCAARTFLMALLLVIAAPVLAQPREVVLRLHGSNTLGSRLGPGMVEAYARHAGFVDVKNVEAAPLEFRIEGRHPDGRVLRAEVMAHGTNTGYNKLVSGDADVWMASRAANAEEVRGAAALGDLQAVGQEHVVALDGLAIIVHPDNPVEKLSVDQIRAAYTGQIRSWAQLGGADRPIRLYGRDDLSGTYDSFKAMVLTARGDAITTGARRYESSTQLERDVAADPDALGFVGFSYLAQSKPLRVYAAGTAALLPEQLSVATEDYLLSRRLYFYTSEAASEDVRQFIEFVLGGGQAVAAQTGFVAQSVFVAQAEPLVGNPESYYDVITAAERLSVNLRFRPQSSALDSRALRDIGRLAEFMNLPENRGKQLRLAAFGIQSDTATPVMTLFTVNDRVDHVATLLSAQGVAVNMGRGFVGGMPVAPLDRPEGRARNERIEVWLHDPRRARRS